MKKRVKISVPFQADKPQELRHIRNIIPLPQVVGHRHRKYSQIQGYRQIVPRGEYPLVDNFFPLIFKQLKLAGNFIVDMETKIIYLCLPYT